MTPVGAGKSRPGRESQASSETTSVTVLLATGANSMEFAPSHEETPVNFQAGNGHPDILNGTAFTDLECGRARRMCPSL